VTWTAHPIAAWTDFHDKVLQAHSEITVPLRASYIYRGQACAEWTLAPSFTRLCSKLGYDRPRAVEIEKLIQRRFKERAHLHLEQRFLPAGSGSLIQTAALSEWWSLMQHYRAPTRLLDWTHSPLVALYFAVRERWETDGAVWCIHRRTLWERSDALYGEPPGELESNEAKMWWSESAQRRVYSFDSTRPTDRMVAQQGAFTIAHDILVDHAEGIAESMPETAEDEGRTTICRRKYTIAAGAKRDLLRRLHQMNIGASGLFPGIDGFGSEMDEIVRLG
jgi:hypothetical protein